MFKKACKCGSLCPVSFGLALGVTGALAVFIWSIWAMYHGMTPAMMAHETTVPTWSTSSMHALLVFVKGFVFGFVLVLFYHLFSCCMKGMCGKKTEENCGCGPTANKSGTANK